MPLIGSGILFIHIPKCGGTSIEVAAGLAEKYPTLGLSLTSTEPEPAKLFGGGLQHLTISEIEQHYHHRLLEPIKYSFSVVRDPVDRFVSHFLWRSYRFSDRNIAITRLTKELHFFSMTFTKR
jgi:hypothetical protein